MRTRPVSALVAAALFLSTAPSIAAYSVLTHEAIIDAAWKDSITPLLVKRFPNVTPEDLIKAQAYAYGGAIIQDMGYYPLGSKFFSDLLHYVRSGDFIRNLIGESQDVNEYSFALGSLAHYAADNHGHPVATNRIVPLMFPKLKKKFGDTITYSDNPAAHATVEFSFDVVQVAQGNYAPTSYHSFIGFEVAHDCLKRAFAKTYSIEMSSIFTSEALAIGTYRYTVSSLLPTMTKAAWSLKRDELQKSQPSLTKKKFIYNISRSEYRKKYGRAYQQPGIGARIIAFVFRIIPKFGPFQAFSFRPTPPAAQTMFMRSFNDTLDQYRKLLTAHRNGALQLPNENFDTGQLTKPGAYRLADDAYAKLLDKVKGKPVSDELRTDILKYFSNLDVAFATKKDEKAWAKVLTGIEEMKAKPEAATRPLADSLR